MELVSQKVQWFINRISYKFLGLIADKYEWPKYFL